MRVTLLFFLFALASVCPAQDKLDFPMRTLAGEETRLGNFYAKGPTLVTFWALWCEPCRVELRALQSMYETYKDRGFIVVAINQDSPKSVSKVRSFVAAQKLSFPVVLDLNTELFQAVNGQAIPYALLFDTDGQVTYKRLGYILGDEQELEQKLLKILPAAK